MTFGPMAASIGAARRTKNYLEVWSNFSWNRPSTQKWAVTGITGTRRPFWVVQNTPGRFHGAV